MKSFGDLKGTIMKKDVPIVSFRFAGGVLQDFKILVSDRVYCHTHIYFVMEMITLQQNYL